MADLGPVSPAAPVGVMRPAGKEDAERRRAARAARRPQPDEGQPATDVAAAETRTGGIVDEHA